MRNLILFMILMLGFNSQAQQGLSANYLRLNATTVPTLCHAGDVRYNASTLVLNLCSPANTWTAVGSGGGGSTSLNGYSILVNNTGSTAAGVSGQNFTLGTPGYTATSPAYQVTSNLAGPYNSILQNLSTNAAASTQYVAANNNGTATTNFGAFGINSSAFTGTGSLNLASATFLYSKSGDLALGTTTANPIHFNINNSATDALTINTSSQLVFPAFSTAGVLLNSGSGVVSSSAGPLAITNGGTGLNSTSQNFAFIGPTSGSGAPSFRALVAGDVPTLNQNTTGTANNVTGTVVVSNGGTGLTTTTPYAILAGGTTSTGVLQQVSGLGTSTQVLTSNGPGALPTWQASASGFTNPMTTGGDLIYGGASGVGTRLANGNSGQVLTSAGGTSAPTWSNTLPLTTKGDLQTFTTTNARLGVGSDYTTLVADSGQNQGLRWANNWKGVKNYIQYSDFENGLSTGWTLGTTGTLTNAIPTGAPTFGSGTTSLSITTVSSGQLAGNTSLSYVASAATTAGNMLASSALTIDSADQAKVLTWKFSYTAFSGTANDNWSGTSSNSFGVALYDVTNSVWLPSTANFAMTQGAGTGVATGTVQTGATTASLRFVVYNANATSGATTIYFDDFFLGPQTQSMGTTVSDWVAYTPTFSAGFGTTTSINFVYRRVGKNLEVRGTFATGTTAASLATMTLPTGLSIDTTAIPNANTSAQVGPQVGFWTGNSINQDGPVLTATGTSTTLVYFSTDGLAGQLTPQNGSTAFGNAQTVAVSLSLPISGWASNSVASSDTDTRVISFFGTQASQAVTANVTDIAFTSSKDTAGAWSGTAYKVPVSGDYMLTGTFINASVTTFQVYKNGSAITNPNLFGASGTGTTVSGSMLVPGLVSGDTISVRSTASVTVTNSTLSIFRLSGPSVVAATESVNARYFASATSISGSLATISWTTKDFDSHNAMSAGTYTIPVTGKYQINMAIALTAASSAAGNAVDIQIQKNGTVVSEISPVYQGTQVTLPQALEDIISCNAGDTIRVQVSSAATTPSITSSNFKNFFSISRVGN